ncbi:MAG: aldo/keto reductase, partial [Erysipelotrichaceae bacterium]|nr:aldo/keto reductase [Erysipelotrichaceae bacterium]
MTISLNNGVEMPVIGIGTFQMTPDEAEHAVETALKTGYRLIDTANAYVNEKAVGRGIRKSGVPRQEIFVETKLWPTLYHDEQAVDKTLERLGVETIDLMLCHQPAGDYIHGYQMLEKAYKEGKIKALGISNFNENQIQKLLDVCEIRPSVLQVECHPYYPQTQLRQQMKEKGIALQAWFPLGHGDKTLFAQPVFKKLADKYGKSVGQIILRWHVQIGNIVIPGARSQGHIQDNINIFDFTLTEEEMKEIATIDRGVPYVTHKE